MEDATFVSGRTQVYGIIGDPITQVRSPEMITGEFQRRGIEALLVPVHFLPADFDAGVATLKRMQNFGGFVFTIPYKASAIPHADSLGPQGEIVGAINVLARRGDKWVGDIFDGLGCIEGFRRRGFSMRGKKLMLMGAGGAGTAIGVAAAFEHPQSMRLFDPDRARVEALAERIRRVDPAIDVTIGEATWQGMDIVLNASPVGMLDDPRMPLDISGIAPEVIVFDAIVKPEPTKFEALAKQRGCQVVYGTEMIRGQLGIGRRLSCESVAHRLRGPSKRSRIRPAVDQEILPGEIARLRAAQERARGAELVRHAEPQRGYAFAAHVEQFFDRLALRLRLPDRGAAQPVGIECAGQQVVDRHVVRDRLARKARHESRQPRSRAIRQAQDCRSAPSPRRT
jgi:shikimate dehydrogenase